MNKTSPAGNQVLARISQPSLVYAALEAADGAWIDGNELAPIGHTLNLCSTIARVRAMAQRKSAVVDCRCLGNAVWVYRMRKLGAGTRD